MLAYVESGVGMATDNGVAAWVFEPARWGCCGQGADESTALSSLAEQIGRPVDLVVAERVEGDEQAFERDAEPATRSERQATAAILAAAREETIALVRGSPPDVLDFDDPDRVLPAFASWRTLRQMAWHLADTESRYYLPGLGLPPRPREPDLLAELAGSYRHVRAAVATMPPDLVRRARGEVWTTTKVLRRLAWHERSELVTMRRLAARARLTS